MAGLDEGGFRVPEHVGRYLRDMGYALPMDPMEEHVREWEAWMAARGDFYDYRDADGFGHVYEVHRRSLRPAARVCTEWASLLLNDKTIVACDSQECTDWVAGFFARTGFMAQAQATVVRAFGLGTAAWAVWLDLDCRRVQVRRYDARMVVPLSWDELGVYECAFVTRVFCKGQPMDQLQLHVRELPDMEGLGGASGGVVRLGEAGGARGLGGLAGRVRDGLRGRVGAGDGSMGAGGRREDGAGASGLGWGHGAAHGGPTWPGGAVGSGSGYKIVTVCFDGQGNVVEPEGVARVVDTGCPFPTFALVRPALDNTRVDMSPYGQSVFADAVDAIQAVDLAFDAMMNEVDVSKMRIFLSDVMFDRERDGGKSVPIPFGKSDCTVFRKVMSTEDLVQEFAPPLRTEAQIDAFRVALQMLGDLCGFGMGYFDFDDAGYVKTATEVSSDNSALMRNIRRHEHALEGALVGIVRAVLECSRRLGERLPDEGEVRVNFDDSIISDTAAEKTQDLAELGLTLAPWEYRAKWYGEDEATARRRCRELGRRGVRGLVEDVRAQV